MPGTLYLLRSNADASLHKIGITNHWHQRAKQLEVGLTTACIGRWTVNDNRQLERFLHRRFKPHRLPQSEWFHLSPDQVQWVVSAASKAADDLKQATNHQPPQPVVYRHPVQPAERPRPHTYQPAQTPLQTAAANRAQRNAQQTPAARAQQATQQGSSGEGLFGACFVGLMLWVGVSTCSYQASKQTYRPATSYSVSRPAAIPSPISSAPALTAEQLELQAQRKAEQKARELAEQLKQQQARDAQQQAREQAEAEQLQQVIAQAEAERAQSLAEAKRKWTERNNAMETCMNKYDVVLTFRERQRICDRQVSNAIWSAELAERL